MSIVDNFSPYLGGTSLKSQTKGTATPDKLLDGETSWVNGEEITGTMPNQGAVSSSLNCGGSYTIPEGYHDGNGKVTANSLASQTSATATADKIISPYTAWVNGVKLTGTGSSGYKIETGTRTMGGSSVYIPLSTITNVEGFMAICVDSGSSSDNPVYGVTSLSNYITYTVAGSSTTFNKANNFSITYGNKYIQVDGITQSSNSYFVDGDYAYVVWGN